jgi:hypothetical protein
MVGMVVDLHTRESFVNLLLVESLSEDKDRLTTLTGVHVVGEPRRGNPTEGTLAPAIGLNPEEAICMV